MELRERLRKSGTRVEEEATDAVLASRETFALRTKLDAYEERTKIAQEMLQVERQRRKEFITETGKLVMVKLLPEIWMTHFDLHLAYNILPIFFSGF